MMLMRLPLTLYADMILLRARHEVAIACHADVAAMMPRHYYARAE